MYYEYIKTTLSNKNPIDKSKIDNIYIKSIIVGLLRYDYVERPSIFNIIDVYNELIKNLKYESSYMVKYQDNARNGILIYIMFYFNCLEFSKIFNVDC